MLFSADVIDGKIILEAAEPLLPGVLHPTLTFWPAPVAVLYPALTDEITVIVMVLDTT